MQITVDMADMNPFLDKITNASSDLIAAKVSAQAKAMCHVDKGRLRNSVMWRSPLRDGGFNTSGGEKASGDEKITPEPKQFEAYVGTNVFYAEYEEYGTRYRPPHPFLRPAYLLVTRQKTKEDIKDMVDAELAMGKLKPGQKRVFD